jgi:hypothetical protein
LAYEFPVIVPIRGTVAQAKPHWKWIDRHPIGVKNVFVLELMNERFEGQRKKNVIVVELLVNVPHVGPSEDQQARPTHVMPQVLDSLGK